MTTEHLDVALIGYQDQGNLGMGYLAAAAQSRGYRVELFEIRDDPDELARLLKERRPLIIGFSLIFQAFLPQFRSVALHLRDAGLASHFTMGGHFPSLCHEEALELFPEVDSIVRYEGEQTLVELIDRLKRGADWRDIDGLAYLDDGRPVATKARALTPDLELAAVSVSSFPLRLDRRLWHASAIGQSGMRAPMFLLFDPHVLPHGSRKGRSRSQAGQSRRGNARTGAPLSDAGFSVSG